MSFPITIDPEAREEFDESYDYYEGQRPGLGDTFAGRIQDVLDRVGQTPQMHAIVYKSIRKAVVVRFPFCIYYRIEPSVVRVIAIFHTSRNPVVWKQRA